VSLLLVTPVTSRQRVFETISDDSRLDCKLKVKVFSTVDKLLSIQTYLLCQIPEQPEISTKYLIFYLLPYYF